MTNDHRWGSEQRSILKATTLQCLKAPILWPQSNKPHAELRLLDSSKPCIFNNPCIKILVLSSVTWEYEPKALELLHLLQCIAAYLQRTLPGRDTLYLGLFSANFHSRVVTHSRKSMKCMKKTLFRRCKKYQIVRKKQTVDPEASNVMTRLWLSIQIM